MGNGFSYVGEGYIWLGEIGEAPIWKSVDSKAAARAYRDTSVVRKGLWLKITLIDPPPKEVNFSIFVINI